MPKENELLDIIEKSKAYSAFGKETREALTEQWTDLVYSGVVSELWDAFAHVFQEDETVEKASKTRAALNRALLSGQAASLKRLQRYTTDKVTGQQKKVGGYSGYGMSARTYLYDVMQRGGQSEINRYVGNGVYKFRLSKQYYRSLIKERANTLIKSVDKTTAELFSKQLIKGLEAGDSKKELVNRLLREAPTIAKYRAEMIVRTETSAAVEFMRHETAKLNGLEFKVWHTAQDELVCPVCGGQDETVTTVAQAFFPINLDYPPAHPNCRCHSEYLLDRRDVLLYENSDIDSSIIDEIYSEEEARKAVKQLWVAEYGRPRKTLNVNALWVGGEGLVGKDKMLSDYIKALEYEGVTTFKAAWKATSWAELDEWAGILDGLAKKHGAELYKSIPSFKMAIASAMTLMLPSHVFIGRNIYAWMTLVQARAKLTDAGFQQLLEQMGSRARVKPRVIMHNKF